MCIFIGAYLWECDFLHLVFPPACEQREPFRRVKAEEMDIDPKFNNSFHYKVNMMD